MKLYVVDTDILGFASRLDANVLQRIRSLSPDDSIVTTIVTFGEDLGGWLPACRRAGNGAARASAYARLQRGLDFYRNWVCLPFDIAAAEIFDRLRSLKLRIGTNDLAISASTLSVDGVLVSRNIVDFRRVPDLLVEDWTVS